MPFLPPSQQRQSTEGNGMQMIAGASTTWQRYQQQTTSMRQQS